TSIPRERLPWPSTMLATASGRHRPPCAAGSLRSVSPHPCSFAGSCILGRVPFPGPVSRVVDSLPGEIRACLKREEVCITPLAGHELVVTTLLDDPTFFHDDNRIRPPNHGEAMRY